jgi:hypothetical protein
MAPSQQQTLYSDCKSITDFINSSIAEVSKFPANLPFPQATHHHLQALRSQGVTLDWTKSHPKQRTSINNYVHRDWGIPLADCTVSNLPLPDLICIPQHLHLSLPDILQTFLDPNTWFVSHPNGLTRMSSPIILKRDTATFNYLAYNSPSKVYPWKFHLQSYARRTTTINSS